MKLMKMFLVAAIIAAFAQSPSLRDAARDRLSNVLQQDAVASTSDQATFDRLCPLFDAYLQVDNTGKKATASALRELADQAAGNTSDPAVRAFLITVPAALGTGSSLQSKAARALLSRECSAHNNPLSK